MFSILFCLFLVWPQSVQAQENAPRELKAIFPVTCVSPGLANGLAKLFETQYKIPVKVISMCAGDAIHFIKDHEGIEDVTSCSGMSLTRKHNL